MLIKLKSPAKINLALYVDGLRSDGFHELITIYQTISLFDELTVRIRRGKAGLKLSCSNEAIPVDSENLIVKAFNEFSKVKKVEYFLEVELTKNIPIGSGLGGGSSNASIMLLLLNKLHKNPLSSKELEKLASKLGSDCPFFIYGGTMLGYGRGEKLKDVKQLEKRIVLLIYPGFSLSTKTIYKNYRVKWLNMDAKKKLKKFEEGIKLLDGIFGDWEDLLKRDLRNDLEIAAIDEFEELDEMKRILKDCGAEVAMMSGSGSSVYGIFKNKEGAKEAKKILQKNWKFVKLVFTLNREEYREILGKI